MHIRFSGNKFVIFKIVISRMDLCVTNVKHELTMLELWAFAAYAPQLQTFELDSNIVTLPFLSVGTTIATWSLARMLRNVSFSLLYLFYLETFFRTVHGLTSPWVTSAGRLNERALSSRWATSGFVGWRKPLLRLLRPVFVFFSLFSHCCYFGSK